MSRNSKYWSRDDVKNWVYEFKRNELLECGCEDPENESLYGESQPVSGYDLSIPYHMSKSRSMQSPETYEVTADAMIQVPHEVIEMIKPLMQQFNVGCPSSFVQAMADVIDIAMDYDVIKPFSTEE